MATPFDVSKFELYHLCCKMIAFSIPRIALYRIIMRGGHVTGLTSDDLHEKIRDIQKVSIRILLLSESFSFLRKIAPAIGIIAKLRHFVTVRKLTYDVIGQ